MITIEKTKELGFQLRRWNKIILGNVEKAVTGKLHAWNGKVIIRGESSMNAIALRLLCYLHCSLNKVQKCSFFFFVPWSQGHDSWSSAPLYSKVKMYAYLLETTLFQALLHFLHTNSLCRTFRKQIYPGVKILFLKVTWFVVMPLLFLILYFF